MINEKLATMLAIIFFSAMQPAWAGNVRCMDVVLGHVLEDFDHMRSSTGIMALDSRYDHVEINLGYVNENAVVIRDVRKECFEVEIPFDSAVQGLRKALLKTTVCEVDEQSCAFARSKKITYSLHIRQ